MGRINREWGTLKRAILKTAKKTLMVKKQAKRKVWIQFETFDMSEKRRNVTR